jgi:hypothetical protein
MFSLHNFIQLKTMLMTTLNIVDYLLPVEECKLLQTNGSFAVAILPE